MSAEKLRMMAASIATGAEIVDRQMVVKDLLEAADEIDALQAETITCPSCKGARVVNGEECEECWGKGRVTL